MRVGTSHKNNVADKGTWDHPHACGDKRQIPLKSRRYMGSSPCVWGQAIITLEYVCGMGIIPMRVGTRRKANCQQKPVRDHPHACGDKTKKYAFIGITPGSSPCVWGQVPFELSASPSPRIIPMRVGTRYRGSPAQRVLQDHPHACGDKSCKFSISCATLGSSPCVWGQDLDSKYYIRHCRIIPMRVGTRYRICTAVRRHTDHPHACGDKHF